MIDDYDDTPAVGAVFVHGSRRAWHNDAPDYDNAALLVSLKHDGGSRAMWVSQSAL